MVSFLADDGLLSVKAYADAVISRRVNESERAVSRRRLWRIEKG